jgi:tetratricopeptide (TPR) repeat protein
VNRHSLKSALLMVAASTFCFSSVSYGQVTQSEQKVSDEIKAQQERIENGFEPADLGKGQEPVKLSRYEEMKSAGGKRPEEFLLNMLGYEFFRQGKIDAAIKLFQKNAQEYPESSNVYDSLGEACAAAGQKALAIGNYEKSLKLEPKNANAVERLKELKEEK